MGRPAALGPGKREDGARTQVAWPAVLVATLCTLVACGGGAGSANSATAPSGGSQPATWSSPVLIEPSGQPTDYDSIYGLSCPTGTFCAAVDESGGALFREEGHWSTPRPVATATGTLQSVSCPTATDCVAVPAASGAVTWNGTSWSQSDPVTTPGDTGLTNISCPTTTFCAGVGTPGIPGPSLITTWDGQRWTAQQTPATGAIGDRLMDVSCATPDFCVAVNLDGKILTFDGSRWSGPTASGMPRLTSVSCPSARFCMVMGGDSSATDVDGRWSGAGTIPGFIAPVVAEVSCSSASRCTAIGLNGLAATWTAGHWAPAVRVFTGGYLATVALSCAPSGPCTAVTSKGDAASTVSGRNS